MNIFKHSDIVGRKRVHLDVSGDMDTHHARLALPQPAAKASGDEAHAIVRYEEGNPAHAQVRDYLSKNADTVSHRIWKDEEHDEHPQLPGHGYGHYLAIRGGQPVVQKLFNQLGHFSVVHVSDNIHVRG